MDIKSLPLTPCIEANGFLFVSGQLGFAAPGELIGGGVKEQTRQTMKNIAEMLEDKNSSLAKVVKMNIWLTDKADFAAFNEAYSEFFEPGKFPARSTVVSGLLIDGAKIEIDAIATKG